MRATCITAITPDWKCYEAEICTIGSSLDALSDDMLFDQNQILAENHGL